MLRILEMRGTACAGRPRLPLWVSGASGLGVSSLRKTSGCGGAGVESRAAATPSSLPPSLRRAVAAGSACCPVRGGSVATEPGKPHVPSSCSPSREGPFPAGELILAQTGKDKRNLRNDFISAASDALIITGGNPVQRDRGQAPRPDGDRLLW